MKFLFVQFIISLLVVVEERPSYDFHTFLVSESQDGYDGYEEEFKGNYIMRQWLEGCEEDESKFKTPSSSVFPVQEPDGYEVECQGNLILKAWLDDE